MFKVLLRISNNPQKINVKGLGSQISGKIPADVTVLIILVQYTNVTN